jgi:hypothetical protein
LFTLTPRFLRLLRSSHLWHSCQQYPRGLLRRRQWKLGVTVIFLMDKFPDFFYWPSYCGYSCSEKLATIGVISFTCQQPLYSVLVSTHLLLCLAVSCLCLLCIVTQPRHSDGDTNDLRYQPFLACRRFHGCRILEM